MSATAIFPSAESVAPPSSGKNGSAASTDEEQAFAALLSGGSVSDIVLASLARQATPDIRLQESGIADRAVDAATPRRDLPEGPEAPLDESRSQRQTDANLPPSDDSALRAPETAALASSSNRVAPDDQKSGRTASPSTPSSTTTEQTAAAQPRATSAQAQSTAGPNPGLRAQVTDAPAELVSQPANTLTGNAAIVAQKATDSRTANVGAVEQTVGLAAQNAQQRALGKGTDARAPGQLAGDAAAAKGAPQTSQPATSPAAPATDAFNAMLATQTAAAQQPAPASANSFARAEQAMLASNGSTGQPVARQAASPAPVQPPKPPVPPRLVTNQVAVQIQKAAAQGSDRINIQLKPAELGRVEVQMDVAKDGRVTAVISAERSETLDLLQRDARSLQSALNDAGLRTDSDSLSFNLKGQNQAQGDNEQDAGAVNGDGVPGDETEGVDGSRQTARQDIVTNDRIDLEV